MSILDEVYLIQLPGLAPRTSLDRDAIGHALGSSLNTECTGRRAVPKCARNPGNPARASGSGVVDSGNNSVAVRPEVGGLT